VTALRDLLGASHGASAALFSGRASTATYRLYAADAAGFSLAATYHDVALSGVAVREASARDVSAGGQVQVGDARASFAADQLTSGLAHAKAGAPTTEDRLSLDGAEHRVVAFEKLGGAVLVVYARKL